jgi:hypothetical protein
MKRAISVFILMLATGIGSLTAQHTRRVDIPPFKKVSVSSDIDLFLKPSSKNDLTIKGEKSVISKIECKVTGDHLEIFMAGTFSWLRNSKAEVYLAFSELEYVAASAGSDVRCDSTINVNQMEIKAQSGSDVYMSLDAKIVKVTLSSGADVTLRGKADELKVNASSGSDLKAQNMKARKVVVDLSSGSDAIIYATEEMIINASGGSDVHYKGSPAVKEINCSGASDVRRF